MQVHLRTKRIKATVFNCNRCAEPIKAGDQYYEWKHNHAPVSRRHVAHGRPRQSELCTGKMSGVYTATEGLEDAISTARADNDPSSLEDALNECAQAVREVGEEYTSGIDNMPESLQYSPTAEDMREKGEALEAFADALESAAQELELEIEDEPEQPLSECTDACVLNQDEVAEDAECDCGYEEQEEQHQTWETDRDDKYDAAYDVADNALGELSI